MQWLNVDMPNAKKSEIVSFVSYLVGMWFWNFASYSKAVLVDLSMWKISGHGKLICLVFAATVDNFLPLLPKKNTRAEIRSAHKRTRRREFYSILQQFTNDILNLGQV